MVLCYTGKKSHSDVEHVCFVTHCYAGTISQYTIAGRRPANLPIFIKQICWIKSSQCRNVNATRHRVAFIGLLQTKGTEWWCWGLFIARFAKDDGWSWCSMLPCRRSLCEWVCWWLVLTCCTLIAQCATGVSPITLTQARWSCFNQPSSTHTATVGFKKISKCICCVNSARWCSEHANDTTALHMFLVSTLTTGWISHLLVSKTDFLCRCTEPSPLLAGEPSIQ